MNNLIVVGSATSKEEAEEVSIVVRNYLIGEHVKQLARGA